MQSEVTPHAMNELALDFNAAVDWVSSAGFPVERGRIAEYRKILIRLAERFEVHRWDDLKDQDFAKQVCTVLLETRELVSIHRGLSSVSDPTDLHTIRLFLKGPFSPINETAKNSSNRPRNIGFELYLTALFAYAKMTPIYGTDADLCFKHNTATFFVEAKRPMFSHSINAAIKDANKQLKRRLEGTQNALAKGLIALDLSKVINPKDKVMPVRDTYHLDQLMNGETKRQINALARYWHINRSDNTVGVLLHFRLLTQFGINGDLNTLRWVSLVQLSSDDALSGLDGKLQDVIRHIC
ncbi:MULTISPECIES: hypothetical protein [Pseudomonas syringae group]|uniref:Uncharacterized protein n=3 Tax=Pseudomonas syringae group TaxID=136849 RepID=A0AAE6QEG6_9PSED|nr:hypothetical protein [Pseudomonas coronafaciens]QGT79793.1 hypothetical protein GMO17_00695 [Pseudomonas coronafaciens pv. coronafaciens]QIQ72567.1 hypothetical protein HBB04_02966 [Pseudomonas coronafaciens]RMS00114.1 hypothetical protein ALP74_200511 [Pseudomonas coronafaciens pv. garcae]